MKKYKALKNFSSGFSTFKAGELYELEDDVAAGYGTRLEVVEEAHGNKRAHKDELPKEDREDRKRRGEKGKQEEEDDDEEENAPSYKDISENDDREDKMIRKAKRK